MNKMSNEDLRKKLRKVLSSNQFWEEVKKKDKIMTEEFNRKLDEMIKEG